MQRVAKCRKPAFLPKCNASQRGSMKNGHSKIWGIESEKKKRGKRYV
nr:MAG TPA: hypothetical protein [Inoviridae sp.]